MPTRDLRIFLSCSFAGHIMVFSALALAQYSLSPRPEAVFFGPAVYCGAMHAGAGPIPAVLARLQPRAGAGHGAVVLPSADPAVPVSVEHYVKPLAGISYISRREAVKSPSIAQNIPFRKDPVFTLHPLLPYQFDLYFKDRQAVHIELEFSVTRSQSRNFVFLRRKISSGNLEADLLSMRYIGHYLFIQQARFAADAWQTVKIEFSPHSR